jgi:acyl transferase domain-containing protein
MHIDTHPQSILLNKTKVILREGTEDINHPLVSQTACTVLQVALVELLSSWNISPKVVVGHSSGEIAAAYCARKISREAAWKIAYYRGLVSGDLHKRGNGTMMAVGATADEVEDRIRRLHVQNGASPEIGCFNSPKNLTITGDRGDLEQLKSSLEKDNVFVRLLPVKVPYHSRYMQDVSEIYSLLLQDLDKARKLETTQKVQMVSSLSGSTVEEGVLDAEYWVKNLISPVQFTQAITNASSGGSSPEDASSANLDEWVEIGPHSTMSSAIKETVAPFTNLKTIEYSHVMTRKAVTNVRILETVAHLYCRGYRVNLDAVNAPAHEPSKGRTMLTVLPPYEMNQEQVSRTQTRIMRNVRFPAFPRHELLGSPATDWIEDEPRWRNFLRTTEMP